MPIAAGATTSPNARPPRTGGRAELFVLPFSAADDSAVTWALERFERAEVDVLLVAHPDPAGITPVELAEVRTRFAGQLRGRYEVYAGHPADPLTRTDVPTLHFVRAGWPAG